MAITIAVVTFCVVVVGIVAAFAYGSRRQGRHARRDPDRDADPR
ncbi:MAG TPA: hypothetical protein VNN07_13865 [Candidatus Tectomicrobia bacterium]|nr:hypothetical protein [Candidatus Tectomicrobia bacterium]